MQPTAINSFIKILLCVVALEVRMQCIGASSPNIGVIPEGLLGFLLGTSKIIQDN